MRTILNIFGLLVMAACASSCSGEPPTAPRTDEPTTAALRLPSHDPEKIPAALRTFEANWNETSASQAIELHRYLRLQESRKGLHQLLIKKTGEDFGWNHHRWQQYAWNQPATFGEDYLAFKHDLYAPIDPRFAAYFKPGHAATARIRLDEIVWGGVKQDGIPPLRNPKMIAANKATYLADRDVVFGIAINGDARAYPNRILAWHEMFTDTIGGIPLCGVY